MIKTVLGDIEDNLVGITLVHEHICCYNEYVYKMSGKDYLDKKELVNVATST
jgi:predicted metal-dependent phosphotriesterase family hydrolase